MFTGETLRCKLLKLKVTIATFQCLSSSYTKLCGNIRLRAFRLQSLWKNPSALTYPDESFCENG